jgi:microcystin synthetase protein McyE
MLSPDGRCKTLDAAADGYVRGEACGGMMLAVLSGDELQVRGKA